MTNIITDPTVVEQTTTTHLKPGVIRYMAPELMLDQGGPSKESDVYSLVMTAYEVRPSKTAQGYH